MWGVLRFTRVSRTVTALKMAFLVLMFISILWTWTIFNSSHRRGEEIGLSSYSGVKAETVRSRLPLIYLITPTYARAEQKAELTRLSYTLRHVERLHWIVIEDAANKTSLVTRFLQCCKVQYTHLYSKTPKPSETFKRLYPTQTVRRGALQRNTGLDWLYAHTQLPSVVYFADDDNTYDLQLFEEMRYTTKVSVWPVGLVGQVRFETAAVKDGKVIRWIVGYKPTRKFAVDMAGFAVNTEYLLRVGKPNFSLVPFDTLLEVDFLGKLNITLDDLEPKADNCSKVLVWHTKTMKTQLSKLEEQKPYLRNYSIPDMEV